MNHRRSARWLFGVIIALALTALAAQSGFTQDSTPQYPLGDIPLSPAEYMAHLKLMPQEMAADLPIAYDARTEGIVTPAKNQGSCGSCWAFASTGAMESHLLKSGFVSSPPDLAEQQQVSCNTTQSGCCGGSSSAIQFWATRGPVQETCFPYGDAGTSCSTAYSKVPCTNGSACAELPYRVTGWHTVSPTTTEFKTSLYTYGPSYWRFTVYSDFYSYWSTYAPGAVYVNRSGTLEGGHAVLLIGWDDAKGAYLCKNSWGGGGPNRDGTFWIAYSGHANNLGFGMANFSVASTFACNDNSDCDDGNSCTTDTCISPGTPQAACSSTWPICGLADGCCGPSCTISNDPDCSRCGDGTCSGGEENCQTCPLDCPSGQGGSCAACFKGKCDGSCNPAKEGPACSDCAVSWCCGDGACEPGETSADCPIDCPPTMCGNGECDAGETLCTCPADCGTPPATETSCTNGLDDDCDQAIDCDDGDCSGNPACCLTKGTACTTASQCCSNKCRGGKCQ